MTDRPEPDELRTAIGLAARAPSIHNSQPWRWVVQGSRLALYADQRRSLPATDPEHRDLMISCGAALHHARIGFGAQGWATRVERFPTAQADLLAVIDFEATADPRDFAAQCEAISRRRTDRRSFSSWPVPNGMITQLADAAVEEGTLLVPILDDSLLHRLDSILVEAALSQDTDPQYRDELATWAGRSASAAEGVPAANLLDSPGERSDRAMRRFPPGTLQSRAGDDPEAGVLVTLATSSDDLLSQLRAGEALSAVLLTATVANLASCPLSQPLEIEGTRIRITDQILHGSAIPQILVRLGWAQSTSPPLPVTPRRSVDEVLSWRSA